MADDVAKNVSQIIAKLQDNMATVVKGEAARDSRLFSCIDFRRTYLARGCSGRWENLDWQVLGEKY